MKGVRLAIMAAALIVAATAVHAQQGPGQRSGQYRDNAGPDSPQGQYGPDAQKREEVRKKIEAVRIWRLTEELKLDEKTSARVASFLSALDEKRRGFLRDRMASMSDLRTLLNAEHPDEHKLKADLEQLQKTRHDMVELEGKEFSGLKEILTVEQQARYVLFQQKFRREMGGMIAGARRGGQGTDPKEENVPQKE